MITLILQPDIRISSTLWTQYAQRKRRTEGRIDSLALYVALCFDAYILLFYHFSYFIFVRFINFIFYFMYTIYNTAQWKKFKTFRLASRLESREYRLMSRRRHFRNRQYIIIIIIVLNSMLFSFFNCVYFWNMKKKIPESFHTENGVGSCWFGNRHDLRLGFGTEEVGLWHGGRQCLL